MSEGVHTDVALITGASRGIGAAIAVRLAQDGMAVACTATTAQGCASTVARIEAAGGVALGLELRVHDPESVDTALAEVERTLGPVSVLVNNAGVACVAPFTEMTIEDFDRVIDVNLRGVFLCSRAAARRMVSGNIAGSIVNIGSVAGINAFPQRAGYCSSKAAVHHLTKVMSLDLAQHRIRVNAVAPGYVGTDLVTDLVEQGSLDLPSLQRRIPLGELGDVEDVANAVAWLISDQARYITGETLVVDGGWCAYGHV